MPFIALIKDTGERVDITAASADFITTFKPDDLICQLCGSNMFPRSGHETTKANGTKYRTRGHFVHVANECNTDFILDDDQRKEMRGQSREHRLGKEYVATEWLQQFGRYRSALVEYERKVEFADKKRIADVLVTFPNGHRIAHEIQLCQITPRELEERTNDYASAGVDVYWHIGRNYPADTDANRIFLADSVADFSHIIFSRSSASNNGVRRA